MPAPRPLPSFENAKRTLAHKLTRKADRIRQFSTKFGLRARRVFLVWTTWSGPIRGEGDEVERFRREILPTPRVGDATSIARNPRSTGVWPEGSIRVDQISAGAYTEENLRGLMVPPCYATAPRGPDGGEQAVDGNPCDPLSDPRVDFFFELVEDGRGVSSQGSPLPRRHRFRLYSGPSRSEGSLYWAVILEAADDELDRSGQSRVDDLDTFEGDP